MLRIEEAVFPQPWSHRLFVEELAQRKTRAYRAAWVDTTIVGFAGQMLIDDEAHVNNIAVDPGWQGRGLGAVLLADLVRTALDRGGRHLTLEVRVGNEPALALYRRFGLAPVGRPAQLLPGDRGRRPDHVGPGHRLGRLRPTTGRHRAVVVRRIRGDGPPVGRALRSGG